MSTVKIGKIGGRPFASRETAEEFVKKYSVCGSIVEHLPFGFVVQLEEGSFTRIAERMIDGNGKTYDHKMFIGRNRASIKNDIPELTAPISEMLERCLSNQNMLDSNTRHWINKLSSEHQKNTLTLENGLVYRLNSAYKRASRCSD